MRLPSFLRTRITRVALAAFSVAALHGAAQAQSLVELYQAARAAR
jgi:hypothetical protein